MITTDSLEQYYQPEEMEKALYIGRTHDDIREFVDHVKRGSDPLRKNRDAFTEKLFFRPRNKSVSENILDQIVLQIEEEISLS